MDYLIGQLNTIASLNNHEILKLQKKIPPFNDHLHNETNWEFNTNDIREQNVYLFGVF